MNWSALPHRAVAKLRALFRRDVLEQDMQAEMAEHLARSTERLMARGFSREDALFHARREFGNVGVLQDEARSARGGVWLDTLRGDLRFALRQIARRPLASATIIGVLALGIGVHAGLFAVFQAFTMRPAPGIRARDELVRLRGKEQPAERGRWFPRALSHPEYLDFAARRDLFATTTAWSTDLVTIDLGTSESATSATTHFVTGDYFATAGVHITVGTVLPLPARADRGDGELVAIVSTALWQDLLASDPNVVGRMIHVNDARVRIVGVAPPRFNGFEPTSSRQTLWMPLATRALVMRGGAQALIVRDSTMLTAAALLAPGVPIERASSVVTVLSDQSIARMSPASDRRVRTADVVPLRADTELPESNDVLYASIVFGLAGVLVLALACTNVSALVVGAGIARSQEIAVRLALGASRGRIVRQLITESCVLAVAGGVTGLALYAVVTRLLANALPDLELAPDIRTALFTLGIAVGTGVLFGLSPALHATRRDVSDVLKGGSAAGVGAARARLQSTFVIAQIAVTQPLLLWIAILLALVLHNDDRHVAERLTSHIVRMRYDLRRAAPETRMKLRAAMRDLTTLPGVEQVASEASGIDHLTFTVADASRSGLLHIDPIDVHLEGTLPGYFAVLDVPIVRGRDLTLADTASIDLPVVISSDVAHELWGNAEPLGRRFNQTPRGESLGRQAIVVGVYDAAVGTTRGNGRRVFTIDVGPGRDYSYFVRTSESARAAVPKLRDHLRRALPELPAARMESLADILAADRREVLQLGAVAATGGVLVLILASIGLYGVIGLALLQRRREIGVRMALGAKPRAVVWLLFRQGVRLAAIGLVLGLPLSIAAAAITSRLSGESKELGAIGINPPLIGSLIALSVVLVASIATWLPARRASRVDPMTALRAE